MRLLLSDGCSNDSAAGPLLLLAGDLVVEVQDVAGDDQRFGPDEDAERVAQPLDGFGW